MLGIVGFFLVFAISLVPIYFINKRYVDYWKEKSTVKQKLYQLGLTGLGLVFMFIGSRIANRLVELFF